MTSDSTELQSTRAFWNANPCGVHAAFELQKSQRYAMEPWLPEQLLRIAKLHASILEVGCGQGVDSIVLCSNMKSGSRYFGIDYSEQSVEVAKANAKSQSSSLNVAPKYATGNAESLDFGDASFQAVYSMGVLHHTARPPVAVSEVLRVLEVGGKAYVVLYRRPSLKVGVAKLLRCFQGALDYIFRTDRCIYHVLRSKSSHSKYFGTMFLECFGVPYMEWYSRDEVSRLFSGFSKVELKTYGPNLGRLNPFGKSETKCGYFWWVEATK